MFVCTCVRVLVSLYVVMFTRKAALCVADMFGMVLVHLQAEVTPWD